jgi:hypothetical protein
VAVEADRLTELELLAAVVVVVLFAAVVLGVAAVVGVAAPVEASTVLEPVAVAAVALAVPANDWRAMPRPRALAMPMLSDATRARLRAAGWGRFVLMGVNVRTVRERLVRVR